MSELVSLNKYPSEFKTALLRKFGFGTDGKFVLDETGNKIKDKYINKAVELDNMLILHGSTIILDDNPISIASYLEEYGDF